MDVGVEGCDVVAPLNEAVRDPAGWGKYAAAVARWESVVGFAPSPTEISVRGTLCLSPPFSEWMMGLPRGWVTDVDLPRRNKLKILGNGVVPQQAVLALRLLGELCE